MVHHVALCILAAYSRTGILAFILQAGLVARTFRIQNAFGTTGFVRIADVLGQASALATIAYGVWTARGQSTRIRGRCYCNWWNDAALREWISGETFHARANWQVIEHVTLSVHSARAWARVRTPLINAGEVTLAFRAQNALWPALRRYTDVIG